MKVALCFGLIIDALLANGFKSIKDLPGCAELKIDDQWRVAVNGHCERTKDSSGVEVPPFCAYIEFNGWPAGFMAAEGGSMAAGTIANEDTLIAALEKFLTPQEAA